MRPWHILSLSVSVALLYNTVTYLINLTRLVDRTVYQKECGARYKPITEHTYQSHTSSDLKRVSRCAVTPLLNSWVLLLALINLIEFHPINLTNWSKSTYIKKSVEHAIMLLVPFVFIFYLVYTYYIPPIQSNWSCKIWCKWYWSK